MVVNVENALLGNVPTRSFVKFVPKSGEHAASIFLSEADGSRTLKNYTYLPNFTL